MTVSVISPHGFCAGVTAALKKALGLFHRAPSAIGGTAAHCLHELVHNELVVRDLRSRGLVFVESVEDIPSGSTVLFSAHGVAPRVRRAAAARNLQIVDATCPFVARVHSAAREFAAKGLPVVVIGNPAHAEVKGIVGEVESGRVEVLDPRVARAASLDLAPGIRIGVVSQTTMNADDVARAVDDLRATFEVETMAEVCHATKVRQDAVRTFCRGLAERTTGGVLVLGSVNSSNTRRLAEIASAEGVRAFRAGTQEEVRGLDFAGTEHLGVTSGASTPEDFFDAAVGWLRKAALALAFASVSLGATAEITVVNGVAYECRDGICAPVETATEDLGKWTPNFVPPSVAEDVESRPSTAEIPSPSTSAALPRLVQGYRNVDEMLAFLKGESDESAATDWVGLPIVAVLLLTLLGGLAMNLTPCVLPMIPVTLMIVGRSARRGCWYGLGIAFGYGALGLLAAVGGIAFGTIQANPWFNAAVAVVFVALALSLAGVWTVDFSKWRPRSSGLSQERRAPDGFAFGMGLLNAVLAGACVAPVLVTVLVLTADGFARGHVAALALPFVLGVGMALPWPFAGAGLRVLPKPGAWMKVVNRVFALVVFAFAVHYGLLAARAFAAYGSVADGGSVTPAEFPSALAAAKRPVFVDCWASWCKNCAAMERTTLADPRVRESLKSFTVIRLQAEDIGELRSISGLDGIRGLPAFVIFD